MQRFRETLQRAAEGTLPQEAEPEPRQHDRPITPVKSRYKRKAEEPKVEQRVALTFSAGSVSSVFGWGKGQQGQVGCGEYGMFACPINLGALAGVAVRRVACGSNHTLALSEDGRIYFWGMYVYPKQQLEE